MKRLLLTYLVLPAFLFSGGKNLLSKKLENAKPGHYILSEQNGNYSMLLVRENNSQKLLLEEITIPRKELNLKKRSGKEWLAKGAPGNTSWILYKLDLKSKKIDYAFSHTRHSKLYLDQGEHYLAQLLSLPMKKMQNHKRKKIGIEPAPGEADTRAVWNPPKMALGKPIKGHPFDAWHGTWKKDGSQLSNCGIDLYFDAQESDFPFPHWIEIASAHYNFKMRVMESGNDAQSPKNIPLK